MLVGVEPGSELAGYRIDRVLATGGTCTVYLAHDPILPRLDALKVLNAALSTDAGSRERFIRESDTGARLHHPNIVSIYSRGEAEAGLLWIAMQYVAGADAEAALASRSMSPPRALRIVGEVAKALDYAHRLGLVHCDVKPSNVLLSAEADISEEHVLLSDFGISRTIGQARHDAALTLSLAYAAPELIAGADIDGRADVYSLGCTLFRLLTGKHVFAQAEGTAGLVEAHLRQAPPRISDFMSGSSPQLDSVIAKALAKDPHKRFVSAREFAEAATDALPQSIPRGAPVQFAPPPVPHPPGPATMGAPWSPSGQWSAPPGAPPPPTGWTPPVVAPRSRPLGRHHANRPHISRRGLLVGFAAMAVSALIAGVVISMNGTTSPPSPPAPAASQANPQPPPMRPDPKAQARLAGLVPPGYPAGTCTPAAVTAAASAAILCGPNADPGGPVSSTYTLARDTPALRAALDDVVHSATPVICPPNILSPGPWHRVENPTATVGIVFCGTRSGVPLVAWTNEPESLLCVTHSGPAGPPLDQLFAWWTSHS